MADKVGSAQGAAKAGASKESWADLCPIYVGYEDAMSPEEVAAGWQKMYELAGMRMMSESEQRSFRLAVYVYAAINGTSREGNYGQHVVLKNGERVPASVIPQAVGKMQIRKFFRGNAAESYTALKQSRALENDNKFVAKVALFGVSASGGFACADWLTNHYQMVPEEIRAHEASLRYALEKARRNRGGRNLEEVEEGRRDDLLKVQGGTGGDGSVGESVW